MSSQDWDSECSRRLEALFSTRGEALGSVLPLPYPPVSTSPGEGQLGGLLQGSYGRRKRTSMQTWLKVGKFMHDSNTHPKAVWQKNFYCTIAVWYLPYLLLIDYLQNVHRNVQCGQLATYICSLCMPGLLVVASTSRKT